MSEWTPKEIIMIVSNIGIGATIALILIWKVIGAIAKVLERLAVIAQVLKTIQEQQGKLVDRLLNIVENRQ